MFAFARTTATAVLLAAGTAGFLALGAGTASAALPADGLTSPLDGVRNVLPTDQLPSGPLIGLPGVAGVPQSAPDAAGIMPTTDDADDLGHRLSKVSDLLAADGNGIEIPVDASSLPDAVQPQSAPAPLPRSASGEPATGLPELDALPLPVDRVAPATTAELGHQALVQQSKIEAVLGDATELTSTSDLVGTTTGSLGGAPVPQSGSDAGLPLVGDATELLGDAPLAGLSL